VLIFIELIFEKSCWIREGHKLQDIKTKDMLHVERIVPRGVVRRVVLCRVQAELHCKCHRPKEPFPMLYGSFSVYAVSSSLFQTQIKNL